MFLKKLIVVLFLLSSFSVLAQENNEQIDRIEQELKALAISDPDLQTSVDISTKTIPIQEYVRLLAKTAEINISIDPQLQYQVSAHFTDETPVNIILHLCKRFNLDATITGSIIYLRENKLEKKINKKKEFYVDYNRYRNSLSYDLQLDTLQQVVKQIIEKTNKNIILEKGLSTQLVTGYIKDMELEEAIGNFAFTNGLLSEKVNENTFVLSQLKSDLNKGSSPQKKNKLQPYQPKSLGVTFNYQIDKDLNGEKKISIEATKAPILDLIKPIADELNLNYVFLKELEGDVTIKAEQLEVDEYFTRVLDATNFSFAKKENLYIFSERENSFVNDIFIYQFKERSADSILQYLPAPYQSKGGLVRRSHIQNENSQKINGEHVELKSIPEYNSILVSGPKNQVHDLKQIFKQMDKRIPLILLELIVVDVRKGNNIDAGLKSLGVGKNPTKTQGNLFDGGMNLGGKTINSILKAIEGIGSINLGRVGPNFFAGLVALENNENIKIRNTTRLSTLNSHIAEFTFGQKDYYVNEQITSTPSINGVQTIENKQYQSIEANTSLKIRPIVSGNEDVTLSVEFSESQFDLTGRIDTQAPPPTDNREFKSLIRVKDQEMIVLGGIEREEKSEKGTGIPFLARVPGIKWLFSNRKKVKNSQRQIVFIRPSIVY